MDKLTGSEWLVLVLMFLGSLFVNNDRAFGGLVLGGGVLVYIYWFLPSVVPIALILMGVGWMLYCLTRF